MAAMTAAALIAPPAGAARVPTESRLTALRLPATGSPDDALAVLSLRTTAPAVRSAGAAASRRVSLAAYASDVEQGVDYEDDEPPPPPPVTAGSKLYVGNLPFNVDSESLAEIFQQSGTVELVEVIYDRESGRSRGFAFVTMASTEEAEAAINQLNESEVGGRMMRVSFPQQGVRGAERGPRERGPMGSRGGASSGSKLYVGNLSWGMTDMGLEELFSEYGQVMEAKVVMDRESGRSRGFGFVTYSTPDEAGEAVKGLNDAEVDGRFIRVSLANDKPMGAPRPRY